MNRRFGGDQMGPEFQQRFSERSQGMTPSQLRNLEAELIREGHARIEAYLKEVGVPFEYTTSVSKLNAHLGKGYPAYVSVNAKNTIFHQPDVSLPPSDRVNFDDIVQQAVPSPRFATTHRHGVFAFGVVPGSLLGGGKKVVLVDSTQNSISIWPSLWMRFVGQGRYLLLYPKDKGP